MNVAYVNPIINATQAIFKTMLHVPMILGRPYLKDRRKPLPGGGLLSATVSLSGGVTGVITLSLPGPVALELASGFAGYPIMRVDADCRDALGEVINIIVGSAKKDLPGGLVTIGLPQLVAADQIQYPSRCPIIVIPVDTGVGRFVIEAAIQETTQSQAA